MADRAVAEANQWGNQKTLHGRAPAHVRCVIRIVKRQVSVPGNTCPRWRRETGRLWGTAAEAVEVEEDIVCVLAEIIV